MRIRQAEEKDLTEILEIVQDAVNLLKQNKVNQWQKGYPNKEVFINDINHKTLFVLDEERQVIGFCNLSKDSDPSYEKIYLGKWLTKINSYVTIHRLAVRKEYYHKGAAKMLLEFSEKYAKENNLISIRVDTHQDNIPMRKLLEKMGYLQCGIIHLIGYSDEDNERIAYEKLL